MIKFKALTFVECRVGKWLVMQEALKRPALPPGIALVPRHKSSELQFELFSRWLSKDAVALACWRLGPADRGRQLARKEVPKSMCGAESAHRFWCCSKQLIVLFQHGLSRQQRVSPRRRKRLRGDCLVDLQRTGVTETSEAEGGCVRSCRVQPCFARKAWQSCHCHCPA